MHYTIILFTFFIYLYVSTYLIYEYISYFVFGRKNIISLVSNILDFKNVHDKLYSSLMNTIISSYFMLWSNDIQTFIYEYHIRN